MWASFRAFSALTGMRDCKRFAGLTLQTFHTLPLNHHSAPTYPSLLSVYFGTILRARPWWRRESGGMRHCMWWHYVFAVHWYYGTSDGDHGIKLRGIKG